MIPDIYTHTYKRIYSYSDAFASIQDVLNGKPASSSLVRD